MDLKMRLANVCRWTARILTTLVIPITSCFLLFVGLQMESGEGGPAGFILYLLFTLAILTGLIIAWWKEGLGAIVSLAGLVGFLGYSLITSGFAGMLYEEAPLAGSLHLIFALIISGYHADDSPIAKMVPLFSWILIILPIGLFLASWLLSREKK